MSKFMRTSERLRSCKLTRFDFLPTQLSAPGSEVDIRPTAHIFQTVAIQGLQILNPLNEKLFLLLS